MTNTLRIKRRGSGTSSAPASLENAELAFNEVNNVLWYGKGAGGAGGSATTIIAIGGEGAFMTISSTQTIDGDKSFTGSLSLANASATTMSSSDNSNRVATTAYVKSQGVATSTATYLTATTQVGLSGSRLLASTADISISDGGAGGSLTIGLTTLVTAATHTKITYDTRGRITGGADLVDADIPVTLARLASPALTGTPTAPTAVTGTNTTQISSTAFVQQELAALVGSAPSTLNTLKELSDAIGADPNFATTLTTSVGTKLTKASNLSDLTDFSAARTNLGLIIGTNVQAQNAGLSSIAGLTMSANTSIYATAANTFVSYSLTSFGRSVAGLADAPAGRTLFGLGTMSTQNANNVAITGGTVDGINFDGGTY